MTTEVLIARLRDTTALSDPLLTHEAADALEALGLEVAELRTEKLELDTQLQLTSASLVAARAELAAIRAQEPVAYWVPKAEQFCIADKSGRPFAKAWEPLYASPAASPRSRPASAGAE